MQLPDVFGGLLARRHHLRRQSRRRDERRDEEAGSIDQRRGRPTELQQHAGGHDRNRAGEPGDQSELRVGLDQLGLGAHGARHERRLAHHVGLLQYERSEHQREKRERVDEAGHQDHQDDADDGDQLDHQSSAAGDSIDRRADQWGDHQKRRHTEREEQQHPAARGVEIDVEEQRVGERHDHRGVARHHQRMGQRQLAELARRHPARRRSSGHGADATAVRKLVRSVRTCTRVRES